MKAGKINRGAAAAGAAKNARRDRHDGPGVDRGALTAVSPPAYDPPAQPAGAGKRELMASFGETLRRERELRRVSLREVSEATKINIRYLEALERDEFDYLPGGAFNKGFIRSYARYIGVDDTEMINAYLYELAQQQQEQKEMESGREVDRLREHFRLPERHESRRRRRARVAVLVAGALLLIAIVAGAAWGIRVLLLGAEEGRLVAPWSQRER